MPGAKIETSLLTRDDSDTAKTKRKERERTEDQPREISRVGAVLRVGKSTAYFPKPEVEES